MLLGFVPQESKTPEQRSKKEKKTYRYTYGPICIKTQQAFYAILIKHILDSSVWIVQSLPTLVKNIKYPQKTLKNNSPLSVTQSDRLRICVIQNDLSTCTPRE